MRRLLYALLLLALLFVPLRRVNIADLLPVESLAVYMEEGQVVLETDTAHRGVGETVEQALAALKENTAKVVYLDTAEYLLISEDAAEQIGALRSHLKDSVKVAVCEAKGKVKEAVEYLRLHQKMPDLREWKNNFKKSQKRA